MKNRRRSRKLLSLDRLQQHAQLHAWRSMNQSTLIIIIRGNFTTRKLSRDLAVSIIEATKLSSIPVVWALNSGNAEEDQESAEAVQNSPTAIDVLKQLVPPNSLANRAHLNKSSAALHVAKYKSTTTEREWFDLLGSDIAGLPQLYIMINIKATGPDSGDTYKWLETFVRLFESLVSKNVSSIMKVVLVSYRNHISRDIP